MATRQDRKDKLVWDALEAPGAGPKQALQLINRRMKKGEKYDYLLALKAHVLTMLPPTDGASNPSAEALAICMQLATRNTLPTPTETLSLLERCFTVLGHREEVGKLYEKVYQAKVSTPGRTGGADEDGLKEWLRACVRVGDWSGAQKAAMSLQKQFSKKRDYYFWAVTACLSLHNSLRQENSLFGTLAYRMIVKAAEDAGLDESARPARAIKTNQELHLLLDTLSSLKKSDESIKWLTSESVGHRSTLVKGEEWTFWSRLADEYRATEKWSELWKLCNEVLENEAKRLEDSNSTDTAEMGQVDWREDWKVWDNLVESAAAAEGGSESERMTTTWDVIKKHVEMRESPHRSILLAEVAFATANERSSSCRVGNAPTLLEASKRYYKHMGSKLCCYEDLRQFVGRLSQAELQPFLDFLEESSPPKSEGDDMKQRVNAVVFKTNELKLKYLLSTSKQATDGGVNTFLDECLKTYSASLSLAEGLMPTDNQHGDDALILSVQTILNIWIPSSNRPLVACAIILEHLLQSSKHNYSALLLLVRVYLLLGAPSQALLVYQRLSIKQIQNDTIAHHVLSRISTILPFASPTAPVATPSEDSPDVGTHTPANPTDALEMLRIALKIYNSGDRQMPRMITQAIDNGNYGQITNFLEFGRRLEMSVCKRLFEVEKRRVKRLRGVNDHVGAGWDDILRIETEDNRDWKIVGEGDWEVKSRLQPDIGSAWVKAFVIADSILLSLSSWSQSSGTDSQEPATAKAPAKGKQQPKDKQDQQQEHLPDSTSRLQEILDANNNEFTPQERASLEFMVKLGRIEAETRSSKSGVKAKALLSEVIEGIKKNGGSVEGGLGGLSLADSAPWVQLHSSYLLLETCKNAILLHDFLVNSAAARTLKPPLAKPALASLKQEAQSLAKHVVKLAADRARAAREVTEDDIDAIMVSKAGAAAGDDPLSPLTAVKSYIKEKVGRQKVEETMDKIGKSQSEAWSAVGKVKV